jgi:hypothetical protein
VNGRKVCDGEREKLDELRWEGMRNWEERINFDLDS